MNRFYGEIGYAEVAVEDVAQPGVWKEPIIERPYFGDVTRNTRQLRDDSKINSNVLTNNVISVVADAYAIQNFHAIRYIWWMGSKWEATSVDVQEHRLIITLGGVYNGPTPESE